MSAHLAQQQSGRFVTGRAGGATPTGGLQLRAGGYAVTPRLRVRVKVIRLYTDERGDRPRQVAVVRFVQTGRVLHVWADGLEAVPS